jgi:hypothetical protein
VPARRRRGLPVSVQDLRRISVGRNQPETNASPLWRCLDAHFDTFLEIYPDVYEREYGFLRPIIPEVVEKFMGCGDFANGFARVRVESARDPPEPAEPIIEPWLEDPFPDYDHEPVIAQN